MDKFITILSVAVCSVLINSSFAVALDFTGDICTRGIGSQLLCLCLLFVGFGLLSLPFLAFDLIDEYNKGNKK